MRLVLVPLAVLALASTAAPAAAHPPPYLHEYVPPAPPPRPKPRGLFEAQVGAGVGRYAAADEQWLALSLGYHRLTLAAGSHHGTERGLDLDLRLGDVGATAGGSSIVVGVRPVVRRIDGDWRLPSMLGLALPEIALSSGDERLSALRVEWSVPIGLSMSKSVVIEWIPVRAGLALTGDGVHASLGTQLCFVIR
jgi:hypothetical protein